VRHALKGTEQEVRVTGCEVGFNGCESTRAAQTWSVKLINWNELRLYTTA